VSGPNKDPCGIESATVWSKLWIFWRCCETFSELRSVLKVKSVVCASLFMIAAHVKQLPLFFCQTLSGIIKVSLLIDWSITLLMIDPRSRGSNRHIRDFLLTYLTK